MTSESPPNPRNPPTKRGSRNPPLPRDVQISKKLSWLLRHGADQEGLPLGPGGFLNLHDCLTTRQIRGLHPTLDEIHHLVAANDKQRFTLRPVDPDAAVASPDPRDWLIRANQGHSLPVAADGLLRPLSAADRPDVVVHGTTHAAWPRIVASGGLKPMTRTHVHFAAGLPAGVTSLVDDDAASSSSSSAPVISGMRQSSTVLIFLDVDKALQAGVKLWMSANGVVLSEGNAEGVVPLEVFRRVEDRTGEGVLVEGGRVVKEAPASWAKGRGKG